MINKKPYIEVKDAADSCREGWDTIVPELNRKIESLGQKKVVICVECYLGTYADFNLKKLKNGLSPNVTCRARDIYKDELEIRQLTAPIMDANASKKLPNLSIADYFDSAKLDALKNNIDFIEEGVVLIHGVGSHLIWPADIIIYSDMSRYEILQRFRRNDVANLGLSNEQEDYDTQHQLSYFVDWRVCDKLKKQLLPMCHYFLETNNWHKPKLADGAIVRNGLKQATKQPFFMAKFFDPELWDMPKHHSNEEDFLWGFDCDIEQNNILLKLDNYLFETPAINILYFQPIDLLGEHIYRSFGTEMPVRFDFLDSMDDNNPKLSVYPGADFLRDYFGFHLYQNDNYYIMQGGSKANVLLGLSEDTNEEKFKADLANSKNKKGVVSQLNKIKVKKHDHLFIPPNTIHSQGQDAIILHIHVAPDIFKLKVYDDNNVRVSQPLELAALEMNKVDKHVLNQTTKSKGVEILAAEHNQMMEIQRINFSSPLQMKTNGVIQVFCLTEGKEVKIESKDDSFGTFIVHYGEAFVIPAGVDEFQINPIAGDQFVILKTQIKR
ncbi:MAG: hypothetical protein ABJF04_08445 [Reichenbachiella sp.]|uniref:hypothetical protein n=1 Tax=Reichenbachiella sp. TaxID=2184521 RepID=UPI003267A262